MRNPTHVVAGMSAALVGAWIAHLPAGVPEVVAGGLAGMLSNMDRLLPEVRENDRSGLRKASAWLKDREVTHSALVMLPLATLLGLLGWALSGRAGMLVAIVAGVLSHLVLDLSGKIGVQLWAPVSRDWTAFPPWEALRPHRGGTAEMLVFSAALGALLYRVGIEVYPYAVLLVRRLQGGGA